jgi:hypothetical protein
MRMKTGGISDADIVSGLLAEDSVAGTLRSLHQRFGRQLTHEMIRHGAITAPNLTGSTRCGDGRWERTVGA